MVSKQSSSDLPVGWTVLFKVLRTGRKVTIYSNLETGKSFMSKDDLLKHIKAESSRSDKPLETKNDTTRHEESTSLEPEPKNCKEELPNWLPNGWRIELRTRKSGPLLGKEYKCYIEPSGTGKFYSKLEVMRYLDAVKYNKNVRKTRKDGESTMVEKKNREQKDDTENGKANVLEKQNRLLEDATEDDKSSILEKKNGCSVDSEDKVDDRKSEAEGLPSGWIKEMKSRQYGKVIKKDLFYTDPVSGYVFRSKKDALRYIETGEISKTAIKPKHSPTNAPESTETEVSTSFEAKRQKLKHPQINKNLFSGDLGKEGSSIRDSKQSRANRSRPLSSKLSPKANVTKSSERDPFDAQVNKKSAEAGILTPAPKIPNGKEFFETTKEKGSVKEAHVNSGKSLGKKVYDLPPRSSKRLAGDEPEKVANLELGERALISSIKKSKKSEVGEDVEPPKVKTKSDAEFVIRSSSQGNKASLKENMAETQEEIYKPESQFSDLFGSDPCLEFAFRTLTGELPLDDTPEDGPILTQSTGTALHKNSPESGTRNKASGKGQFSRISKSKNKKEPELPRRSSRRVSVGDALPDEQSHRNGTVSAADMVEPSSKRGKPKSREIGKSQPERSEPLNHKSETQEPDLSFSIADYWSDPCLDFAFKTLTGVIPIEDSLVQSYFQEQEDDFNGNKDSKGPTLPNFGSSSFFQTDRRSSFEASEKSPSGRLSNCNGVHSQQQSLEGSNTNNKNSSELQLKVKS